MTAATQLLDMLRPRPAESWRHALWLALAAHGLLLLALMFSVQWHTAVPPTVEAEMWSEIPRVAQPERAPPPPAPAPEPEPAPAPPAPKPEPAPPPPAEPPSPSPAPKPVEIPVRQVSKPLPKPAPKPPKVVKPEPRPEPAPAPVPVPSPAPKPASKPPAKPAPKNEPKTEAKAEVKEAAPPVKGPTKEEVDRTRKANLDRMMNDLSQDPSHSSGPSANYSGRIRARIKPNIVFWETSGNPLTIVEVRCSPTGQIIGRKVLTPSGVEAWDDAVLRALDRTEVLPLDEKGKVPSVLLLEFRPKDF